MSLLLTITNVDKLDNGQPTQLRLDRHGAVIGRSPHSDWSLPDPNNYVSSTHCEVDYRDGAYTLVDKSTNGTFLNGADQRMSGPHVLKDGDVVAVGHYRVSVSGAGAGASAGGTASGSSAAPPPPPSGGGVGGGWGGWGADAAPAPAAQPSAGWESASSGWDKPAQSSGWGEVAAPAALTGQDAGWATPAASGGQASGWGAASSETASAWDAADVAPPATGGWGAPAAPAASGWSAPTPATPSWDAPTPQPSPSPAAAWGAPASPPAHQPQASAGASDVWGAAGAGPARPLASGWDAIAPARGIGDTQAASFIDAAPPVSGRGALAQNWSPPRIDSPAPPPPSGVDVWGAMAASNTVDWSRGGFGEAASAPTPAAFAAAPGRDDAWAALLQAAGLSSADLKADPAVAGAAAGGLLKRLVAGLVVMMEARARAKAQLGAQSTSLELNGNNPIKFARSPERVLAQLLNPPERGFMGAGDAVEDSFRDLQAHQMATLAAMQGALRSTLDRFSPKAIRQRAEMRGVLARILPGARNATLWEAYEREFEGVAQSSDEAFMDVFAKAFKQAYEEASAQMKSKPR